MPTTVPQSKAELIQHLEEQLAFIEASSKAYDEGFDGEAKRLAVAIRVLVHDTRYSKSLLAQLELKQILFCDMSRDYDPRNLLAQCGLAIMTFTVGANNPKYVPLLDKYHLAPTRYVSFDTWWHKIVFKGADNNSLTREQMVLSVADQDGGAHVDPSLNEAYARFTRQNSMGLSLSEDGINFTEGKGVGSACIRHIAFELLKSLREKKITGAVISKVGRNDLCPCNSGIKYKKCHGR